MKWIEILNLSKKFGEKLNFLKMIWNFFVGKKQNAFRFKERQLEKLELSIFKLKKWRETKLLYHYFQLRMKR
jgi:hypothetical protein